MTTQTPAPPVGTNPRVRSAITLMVLLVLLATAAIVGWRAVSKPKSGQPAEVVCTDVTLEPGSILRPGSVTVSVLNAGAPAGQAGRTLDDLTKRGFGRGEVGDAPGRANVRVAEIWTNEPDSAVVALVRSWVGKGATKVIKRDPVRPGINLVIGKNFPGVAGGRKELVLNRAQTVCAPPGLG